MDCPQPPRSRRMGRQILVYDSAELQWAYMADGVRIAKYHHNEDEDEDAQSSVYPEGVFKTNIAYMSDNDEDLGSKWCSFSEVCKHELDFVLVGAAQSAGIAVERCEDYYKLDKIPPRETFLEIVGMLWVLPQGAVEGDKENGWLQFLCKHTKFVDSRTTVPAGMRWFLAYHLATRECDDLLIRFWNKNVGAHQRLQTVSYNNSNISDNVNGHPNPWRIEWWREIVEADRDEDAIMAPSVDSEHGGNANDEQVQTLEKQNREKASELRAQRALCRTEADKAPCAKRKLGERARGLAGELGGRAGGLVGGPNASDSCILQEPEAVEDDDSTLWSVQALAVVRDEGVEEDEMPVEQFAQPHVVLATAVVLDCSQNVELLQEQADEQVGKEAGSEEAMGLAEGQPDWEAKWAVVEAVCAATEAAAREAAQNHKEAMRLCEELALKRNCADAAASRAHKQGRCGCGKAAG
mmetsp:Transcript_29136/g.59696  ORF Transcript_29136/g.59696 Transcript_29136/m.59696 type:complete len:466 (-) Transcript_29136:258-1655(-)